jgi:Protein of unknown function (DUF4245)
VSQPTGAPSGSLPLRARTGVRHMAIALAVLVVPIVAIVLIGQSGRDPVVRVDPEPAFAAAQSAAGFDVRRPEGLSKDWAPTSADSRRRTGGYVVRVGYVTPEGGFAQVVQSGEPVEEVLVRELGGQRRQSGTERIDGRVWQTYPGRTSDETAFVLLEPKVTTVVIGSADRGELTELVRSLR